MDDQSAEELSFRAEIFRSKLIEDFQLLDSLLAKGNIEPPKYYSNEIQDPIIMEKLLKDSPFSLVKFQVYAKREEAQFNDRRLNRIRNKNRIPFGPWAHALAENQMLQNFIMFLIIANSLVLGIQAEVKEDKSKTMSWIKVFLNVCDYVTLIVFMMEIMVKWIDGFWMFWQNGWNIFDFIITVMSILPEVMKWVTVTSSSQLSIVAENMRVFKILRSLKMVSRFAQLRIIVLTIFKAFKSMAFILILLGLFMYIFAVAGTIVFDSYAKSPRTDLKYKNSFSTLKNANITLFQLFTLDHWYEILMDMIKVVDPVTAKIYVILWICIGAFIFRNIFAGIMVNNFQNIRNDFNMQLKEQLATKEREAVRHQLADELEKQDKLHGKSRRTSSIEAEAPSDIPEGKRKSSFLQKVFKRSTPTILEPLPEEPKESTGPKQPEFMIKLQEKIAERNLRRFNQDTAKDLGSKQGGLSPSSSFHAYYEETTTQTNTIPSDEEEDDEEEIVITTDNVEKKVTIETEINEEVECTEWSKTVEGNLHNFERYPMETLWPRDTLFKYFRLMECLQENITERKQLMRILVESLLQLVDTLDRQEATN